MSENFYEGYTPLFELGIYEDKNPAVKILQEINICPTELAALCVVLFDVVMRTVPESNQNLFEDTFNKSFNMIMEERFGYDTIVKYPDDE